MLKRVTIENVQSHKHTVMEFSPGLNVITGPTHSGKTAFLRALEYGLRNISIGPDVMMRHGENLFSIEFDVDGRIIKRERGGRVNRYTLDGDEKETVGKAVPGDIEEWLGKASVTIGKENYDLCFRGQYDGHFLVKESPGIAAKAIGKLSSVEVLDEAVRMENERSAALKKSSEQAKAKALELDIRISNLSDTEKFRQSFDVLKQAEAYLKDLGEKQDKLSSFRDKIHSLENSISKDPFFVEHAEKDLSEKLTLLSTKLANISVLINLKKQYLQAKRILFRSVDFVALENNVTDLEAYIEDLLERCNKLSQIKFVAPKVQTVQRWARIKEELRIVGPKLKTLQTTTNKVETLEGLKGVVVELVDLRSSITESNQEIQNNIKNQKIAENALSKLESEAKADLQSIDTCSKCKQPNFGITLEGIL